MNNDIYDEVAMNYQRFLSLWVRQKYKNLNIQEQNIFSSNKKLIHYTLRDITQQKRFLAGVFFDNI